MAGKAPTNPRKARLPESVKLQLNTIHSRLFMIYVMLEQGRAPLVNMGVFKSTLNELEALYADAIPEW